MSIIHKTYFREWILRLRGMQIYAIVQSPKEMSHQFQDILNI